MTATPERHMVFIETEKTGRIDMTPEQFDILLECALVGLDGYPHESNAADDLHAKLHKALARHTA
jgi:hypothetical protein